MSVSGRGEVFLCGLDGYELANVVRFEAKRVRSFPCHCLLPLSANIELERTAGTEVIQQIITRFSVRDSCFVGRTTNVRTTNVTGVVSCARRIPPVTILSPTDNFAVMRRVIAALNQCVRQ